MIGKLSGRLDYRGADHVLIDTGGVGYIVHCSERTLAAMPAPGAAVALYTDLLVREDLMQLYGFRTLAEREWHRLLMTVQGVGAKAALAVTRKGATVVCGGIHMSDIPAFPYRLLWEERVVRSVANLTRRDAVDFLALAPTVPVRCAVEIFPLADAEAALARLRDGRLTGAAVLVP